MIRVKTAFGKYLDDNGIKSVYVSKKIGLTSGAISNYCKQDQDGKPFRGTKYNHYEKNIYALKR